MFKHTSLWRIFHICPCMLRSQRSISPCRKRGDRSRWRRAGGGVSGSNFSIPGSLYGPKAEPRVLGGGEVRLGVCRCLQVSQVSCDFSPDHGFEDCPLDSIPASSPFLSSTSPVEPPLPQRVGLRPLWWPTSPAVVPYKGSPCSAWPPCCRPMTRTGGLR